jgi:hypothetical protein
LQVETEMGAAPNVGVIEGFFDHLAFERV